MAPERTSLRTVLKCVVLPLLGLDEGAFSPDRGDPSLGIGGAGIVGGLGVCKCADGVAELDAEAPGTYPRDSLAPPFSSTVVSRDSLGAVAPAFIRARNCSTCRAKLRNPDNCLS